MFILDEGKVSYQKNTVFFSHVQNNANLSMTNSRGATRIFERGQILLKSLI